jgi:hypothetical protein
MQCRSGKAQLHKAQESLGTVYTAHLNSASASLRHGSCDHCGGRCSMAVWFVLGFVVNKVVLRQVFLPVIRFPPVTTAWHVLRSEMKERPPIWRVDANILNKESRTADKGVFSSLWFGRGADNLALSRNRYQCLGFPPSASFHHCSIRLPSPVTDAVYS